jgi:hypothetical protein
MNIRVKFALSEEDFVAARLLSYRPSRLIKYLLYVMLGLYLVLLLSFAYEMLLGRSKANDFALLLGGGLYFLAVYFLLLPWMARLAYKKDKFAERILEYSFSEGSLRDHSMADPVDIPWTKLSKWKYDKRIVLFYDQLGVVRMIPWSAFSKDKERAELLSYLEKKCLGLRD